ncbi:MAG TPA: hypothetical protein VFN71_09065 [Methylomirabilota bacterium]|nr:hypothetical protein [Methylomirabilota bacterium]
MKADDRAGAGGQPAAADSVKSGQPAPARPGLESELTRLLAALKEVSSGNAPALGPGTLLSELTQCLTGMLGLVQSTAAHLRPGCEQTLSSVTLTLTAMIRATEAVAGQVLDQAEGLRAGQQRVKEVLSRLSPYLSASDLGASRALVEATEAVQGLSERIAGIVSTMEFQDVMAQHLGAAIKAIEGLQGGLREILAVIKLPPDAETPHPARLDPRIGAPAAPAPWRQDLADQVFADLKQESGR